jgi:hypothetical protein
MGRVYDTSTKFSSVYTAVCTHTAVLNLVYLYCVERNNTSLALAGLVISYHTVKVRWDSDLYAVDLPACVPVQLCKF